MADSTGVGRSPSLPPKKGRGSSWQYQETAALLQLWGQARVQEELRTRHRNLETFERIAEGMRRRGFPRGAAECRTKTKKLKGEYKQALRRLAGGGASRRDGDDGDAGGKEEEEEDQEARRWPFFRTLARILRHQQDQEEPPTPTTTLQEGETPQRPPAFQDARSEIPLNFLVKEEEANEAEEGSFDEPAAEATTPTMSVSQPGSDPEGCSPAAAAALQPPARLAWHRRRKTKPAKVESLLLQMLHQDAEEARETRESVEHGWARLEAWAQAEQESRAREDEREQQHRQEVLSCLRETNGLIRRLVGDTNQLLERILEAAPRTEAAGEAGSAADGASGAGDQAGRPRTVHAEGRLG